MTLSSVSSAGWLAATIRGALTETLALLFPVWCAGCDEPDIALCETCAAALRPHGAMPVLDAAGVRVFSGLAFDGAPARVVRALKEDGRTSLARALAPALRAAYDEATGPGAGGGGPRVPREVIVVPVPTSRAAYRRRGYRVVELIASRAGLRCRRLLVPVRGTADQRGLSRSARRDNVASSLRARGAEGLRIVIVDDVVTTGATLAEAARALRAGGADVVGAVTVAATRRRLPWRAEP